MLDTICIALKGHQKFAAYVFFTTGQWLTLGGDRTPVEQRNILQVCMSRERHESRKWFSEFDKLNAEGSVASLWQETDLNSQQSIHPQVPDNKWILSLFRLLTAVLLMVLNNSHR